jgi:hypothetical protein
VNAVLEKAVMSPPDCPQLPHPTAEHQISPEAIREEERFELEISERGFLAGPRSRMHDLGTILRVGADFVRAGGDDLRVRPHPAGHHVL